MEVTVCKNTTIAAAGALVFSINSGPVSVKYTVNYIHPDVWIALSETAAAGGRANVPSPDGSEIAVENGTVYLATGGADNAVITVPAEAMVSAFALAAVLKN